MLSSNVPFMITWTWLSAKYLYPHHCTVKSASTHFYCYHYHHNHIYEKASLSFFATVNLFHLRKILYLYLCIKMHMGAGWIKWNMNMRKYTVWNSRNGLTWLSPTLTFTYTVCTQHCAWQINALRQKINYIMVAVIFVIVHFKFFTCSLLYKQVKHIEYPIGFQKWDWLDDTLFMRWFITLIYIRLPDWGKK